MLYDIIKRDGKISPPRRIYFHCHSLGILKDGILYCDWSCDIEGILGIDAWLAFSCSSRSFASFFAVSEISSI